MAAHRGIGDSPKTRRLADPRLIKLKAALWGRFALSKCLYIYW